jgi:hypothetical protein
VISSQEAELAAWTTFAAAALAGAITRTEVEGMYSTKAMASEADNMLYEWRKRRDALEAADAKYQKGEYKP